MEDWYNVEAQPIKWIVDGLLPADGYHAFVGKPKGGKSTNLTDLTAAVIQGRTYLGRKINTDEPGRVLYVHLDRKDRPARVIARFKGLGITREESARLHLKFAEDIPWESLDDRMKWLQSEIAPFQPHLVVVDLLPQFLCSESINDYAQQLAGINALQDALSDVNYKGALIAALHGRKATNPNQPFDDVLGSTALRGSFSTLVMFTQHRVEGVYTIQSDQTDREAPWGEIEETIVTSAPDGTMSLGRPLRELAKDAKRATQNDDIVRLWNFLDEHPGSEAEFIRSHLHITGAKLVRLAEIGKNQIYYIGKGIKGDPKKYFAKPILGDYGSELTGGETMNTPPN